MNEYPKERVVIYITIYVVEGTRWGILFTQETPTLRGSLSKLAPE